MKTRIIAISGTQGAGKSTVLQHLGLLGYNVDDFKVSRHVQSQLKGELKDLIKTFEDVKHLQKMILDAKIEREERLLCQDLGIIFTERSFADISSYANVWVNDLIKDDYSIYDEAIKFKRDFADYCSDFQQIYAGIVNIPHMEHIEFVDDPHRGAKNKRDEFNVQMNKFFLTLQPSSIPILTITAPDVAERVHQIQDFLRTL